MRISTKSRYGIRAILELAAEYGKGPLRIKSIGQRQGISVKYLEQLIAILKSAGFVRSIRGPKGGYILAKPPSEIKLADVFNTLEGPHVTVECFEHQTCALCTNCATRRVWSEMQKAMVAVLESVTLQDLVDEAREKDGKQTINYQI